MTIDDIHAVRVPVPYPVKATNCYMAEGAEGWDIIDTGARTEAAEEVWTEAFRERNIRPGDVNRLYITHYHPDHLGMAGWLQKHMGGTVHMHHIEANWVSRVWAEGMPQAKEVANQFRYHGMPEEWAQDIEEQFTLQRHDVLPLPTEILKLSDGQQVPFGDMQLQLLWTPGHSDGHFALWSQELDTMIIGDLIEGRLTPNVGLWPHCDSNPLRSFFESLRKALSLQLSSYLPGHGRPVKAERFEELFQHHEERLAFMAELAGEGRTAFEICEKSFSERELTAHQMRFALAETMAHMKLLEERGDVRLRLREDGQEVYVRERGK